MIVPILRRRRMTPAPITLLSHKGRRDKTHHTRTQRQSMERILRRTQRARQSRRFRAILAILHPHVRPMAQTTRMRSLVRHRRIPPHSLQLLTWAHKLASPRILPIALPMTTLRVSHLPTRASPALLTRTHTHLVHRSRARRTTPTPLPRAGRGSRTRRSHRASTSRTPNHRVPISRSRSESAPSVVRAGVHGSDHD